MFIIDKYNKIKLTKGDTASIFIEVYDLDNKKYEIKSTDVITLTVRKSAQAAIAFQETANDEHYIVINSSDTSSLATGLYVYDIQLTTGDGYVYTICPENFFEITNEITY